MITDEPPSTGDLNKDYYKSKAEGFYRAYHKRCRAILPVSSTLYNVSHNGYHRNSIITWFLGKESCSGKQLVFKMLLGLRY